MLAIELVRILLGFGAFISGMWGMMFILDPIGENDNANTSFLITVILLTIMFNI